MDIWYLHEPDALFVQGSTPVEATSASEAETLKIGISMELAEEWSLVLQSRNVPHKVTQAQGQPHLRNLSVNSDALGIAISELTAFHRENRNRILLADLRTVQRESSPWGVLTVLLPLFFVLSNTPWPAVDLYPSMWINAGGAHAEAICNGQIWRTVTALFLHGDAAHLLGNVVSGALFASLVCGRLGAGMGWVLILFSAALANGLNAVVQSPAHHSIGFSTAVFAAAGLICGLTAFQGSRSLRTMLIPVAAGLGLLAMLGSTGEKTDLGAHLFGLLVGIVVGYGTGVLHGKYGEASEHTQVLCAAVAASSILLSWAWAFSWVVFQF